MGNVSQSSVLVRVCCVYVTAVNSSWAPLSSHQLFLPLAGWCSWKQESDFPSQETALHLQKFWERGDLLRLCAGRSWIIWKNCGPGLLWKQNGLIRENVSSQKLKLNRLQRSDLIGSPHKIITTHETNQDYFLLRKSTTLVTKLVSPPISSVLGIVL